MTYYLGKTSRSRLQGVHPDLVKVVELAISISEQDFSVLEGKRSLHRQKQMVAQGVSKTMNSRHLTGHAVDIIPYPMPSGSWKRKWWNEIATAMKMASEELKIPIDSGHNDWGWDSPHFQLTWEKYPK